METKLTIAQQVVEQLEKDGLKIIPRGGHDANIRGCFDWVQEQALHEALPFLNNHWREILEVLAQQQGNEAARAAIKNLDSESSLS